jgi:hypothetical protein
MPRIPLEALSQEVRERAQSIIEHPTLVTRGPIESFACQPATYRWLLDHPDQAVQMWRLLGAKVADINDLGKGRFVWRDRNGSEVIWNTILDRGGLRIWHAEGRVRPGMLVPAARIHAVAVATYQEGTDGKGRPAMRHQMHLFLHTDNRALTLAARLLGGSVPRLGEEYMAQMQLFFGGLAWYLNQDPARAERMFQHLRLSAPAKPANPS